MLGLTLNEAHQLLDVAWSVYAVGGVEAYAEVQMAASAAEGAALGILASVIAALDGGYGARLPGTRPTRYRKYRDCVTNKLFWPCWPSSGPVLRVEAMGFLSRSVQLSVPRRMC
jgi:hypothetical protein